MARGLSPREWGLLPFRPGRTMSMRPIPGVLRGVLLQWGVGPGLGWAIPGRSPGAYAPMAFALGGFPGHPRPPGACEIASSQATSAVHPGAFRGLLRASGYGTGSGRTSSPKFGIISLVLETLILAGSCDSRTGRHPKRPPEALMLR